MPAFVAKAEAAALTLTFLGTGVAVAGGLDLTPKERLAFGNEVRALLVDEPDIVGRALDIGTAPDASGFADEAAVDAALLASEADALTDDPGDWSEGPTGAPALVAFLPAACAKCPAILAELRVVTARTGARLVVKDTAEAHPEAARFLTAVLREVGPDAWLRAREGLAALEDPDDPAGLSGLAASLGWPPRPLFEELNDPATQARIERVKRLALRLGFDIAPSYVVGGILVRGDVPPIVLERYLSP